MKKVILGLLVLGSISSYAQSFIKERIKINNNSLSDFNASEVECLRGNKGLYTDLNLTFRDGSSTDVRVSLQKKDNSCSV
ncbi:MAG: hypothetical protein N4A33_10775 [Bacteriovoracaceae bacterium]|jgi:hypothetical protein|nr:hypothetical protein [Bacteriovoracaceae bacterium]